MSYGYDQANRLISVGGMAYSWDANGNLLSDGASTYAYDSANRLSSVTTGGTTYQYVYDGDGDRVAQVVGSTTTRYALDTENGLTQVLSDGTEDYLYGNERIAQQDSVSTGYFLGDALGGVRQLSGDTGAVTLSRQYDPFGNVIASSGTGTTSYGFDAEWADSYIKLVYLRSRYTSTDTGRFITKDTWQGNNKLPMSYNEWVYGYDNPVNYIDPSGNAVRLPDLCQGMPTKGLFELCILNRYGLEPIDPFELGATVNGQQDCYTGPTAYRAPGYLEGTEWYVGGLPFVANGNEVVYDFATMERENFTFTGGGFNSGVIGAGSSFYWGKVLGFRSDDSVITQYQAVSLTGSYGGSFGIGFGIDIGRSGFISGADSLLRGDTWYIGGSVSPSQKPVDLEWSGATVNYKPVQVKSELYRNADGKTVDRGRLYSDIVSGAASPWPYYGPIPYLDPIYDAVRLYARFFLVDKFADAYEALHYGNQ